MFNHSTALRFCSSHLPTWMVHVHILTHTHTCIYMYVYTYTPVHMHPGSVRPLRWVWLTLRMASYLLWCRKTGRWGCSHFSLASYTECLMSHLTYSLSSNRSDDSYCCTFVSPTRSEREFYKVCISWSISSFKLYPCCANRDQYTYTCTFLPVIYRGSPTH